MTETLSPQSQFQRESKPNSHDVLKGQVPAEVAAMLALVATYAEDNDTLNIIHDFTNEIFLLACFQKGGPYRQLTELTSEEAVHRSLQFDVLFFPGNPAWKQLYEWAKAQLTQSQGADKVMAAVEVIDQTTLEAINKLNQPLSDAFLARLKQRARFNP